MVEPPGRVVEPGRVVPWLAHRLRNHTGCGNSGAATAGAETGATGCPHLHHQKLQAELMFASTTDHFAQALVGLFDQHLLQIIQQRFIFFSLCNQTNCLILREEPSSPPIFASWLTRPTALFAARTSTAPRTSPVAPAQTPKHRRLASHGQR